MKSFGRKEEPQADTWPQRDALFRIMVKGTYGRLLSDRQVEQLRKVRFGEQEITKRVAAQQLLLIGKVLLRGFNTEKVDEHMEHVLAPLDDEEKQATKLVTGYHPEYCEHGAFTYSKEDLASRISATPEQLDILLASALAKLSDNQSSSAAK